MRRRDFITLVGDAATRRRGGAATWRLATRAQQPGLRRIGVLIYFCCDAQHTPILRTC
jgi:hypothetical protein